MNYKIELKAAFYGLLHLLVGFTSIVVVTTILEFNLPTAFLFAGISTIIFHIITKNKLPMVMGVSGLYVGSILYVIEKYGREYVAGGVIFAGLLYIVFAFCFLKWQDRIMKYFPNWLLSTVIMLIGLNLMPIGKDLIAGNVVVGLSAFAATALSDLSKNKYLNMFSMPIGIICGTIIQLIFFGIDVTPLTQELTMEFISPKFAWGPALTIGLLGIAVIFECLGDSKNTSDIVGFDVFKEVGLFKILLGNGVATTISGAFNQNAYTTYSENAGFLLLSKYYNPWAQVFTGIGFIILSFITPISKLILCLPITAFGGVVTYLFSIITINSIKQLCNSGINLATDKKQFVIISIMIGLSFVSFLIGGISISSVAIATIIGMILNIIIKE